MGDSEVVRFDPHVHTNASADARGSVREVLQRADAVGLDAIAITDHDTTDGARRALDSDTDVVVVPGVEISTADGHLLALGVTAEPPIHEPLATTIEWVRAHGGLAVIPHPFQRLRHGVSKGALTACDGIEVFNAWAVTGIQNRRAAAVAARTGQPAIGASDAHRPGMVGRAYTELPGETAMTVDGVLDAVAHGQCRAAGESHAAWASLRRYARSLRRVVSPHTHSTGG